MSVSSWVLVLIVENLVCYFLYRKACRYMDKKRMEKEEEFYKTKIVPLLYQHD